MKLHFKARGMVFAITLMITVVCLMFVGALTQMTSQDLGNTGQTRDRLRALELAKSGLNHTLHILTYDQSFAGTIQQSFDSGQYFVSFDASTPAKLRSTNRLSYPGMGIGSEELLGVTGQPIYGHQVEIVSQGKVGRVVVKLRSLATTGFTFNRSIGCAGSFNLTGSGLTLGGIQSLASQDPADGGIYCTKSSGVPVQLNNLPITFSSESRIETSAGLAGVAGLAPAENNRVSQLSGNSKKIPEFEVGKVVDKKLLTVSANPRELQAIPGGFSLPSTSIDREYSVNGKLTVNGDLNLTDGTLYVKGDLDVNGGIMGVGSVFVDGKVTVNGGTSVLSTNQSSGAALFASGDVKFQGQSAAGYLDSLITSYPASTLAASKAAYNTTFNAYQTAATSPVATVSSIATAATDLVSSPAVNLHGSTSSNYFINPIPGPSGLRTLHAAPAPIPALINSIKTTLGPAYSGDARAQKIVHALEEEAYACRQDLSATDFPASRIDPDYKVRTAGVVDLLGTQTGGPFEADQPHYININWNRGTSGYTDGINGASHSNTDSTEVALWDGTNRLPYPTSGKANALGPNPFFKDDRQGWNQPWCDSAYPSFSPYFKDMTVDHQNRILTPMVIPDYLQSHFGATVNPAKVSQAKSDLLNEFRSAQKAFVLNHPADFSWLSRSAFQGLVYSGGNVTVDGEFEIQGSVLSQGDVNINAAGPCKLIYNQEYFRTRGAVGPVTPVSVQQI